MEKEMRHFRVILKILQLNSRLDEKYSFYGIRYKSVTNFLVTAAY
jgi:hypothetical protein